MILIYFYCVYIYITTKKMILIISAILLTLFILLIILKSLIFKIIIIGIGAFLLTPIIFHYVIELINNIFIL